WPESLDAFQVQIANTPSVPLGSNGAYPYAQLMYTEPNTGVLESELAGSASISSTGPGRSLVMLSDGATPQGAEVFFLRVYHAEWNDAQFLFDGVPATIGQAIPDGFDHDPAAGGPFLYFNMAHVNRQENYYNRETRTGPVIPVNEDSPSV